MKYYWVIKRVKDEPIKVSPTVGEKAQASWLAGTEKILLPHNIAVMSSTISAIEPTTDPYEEQNVYKLGDGIPDAKVSAVLNEDGSVMCNWYKKACGIQAWEKYYAPRPGYYKLIDSSNQVWVAMYLPEEYNRFKSKELELCTDKEQELLHELRANHQSS